MKRWRVTWLDTNMRPPHPFGKCEEIVEAETKFEARIKAEEKLPRYAEIRAISPIKS